MASKTDFRRVSFGTKLGYSFGNFGESIAYNLFYLFFMIFLTAVAGIDPAVAGTISLVAVLWDAVTDPLIGYWSDSKRGSKGRRRPFLIRFAIPLGAVVILMFTAFQNLSGPVQVLYFLVMNIAFWFLFTAVDIPYITLGGEIVDDPKDKTMIRGMATSWNFAGFAVVASAAFPIIVSLADKEAYPDDMAMLDPAAWSKAAILFGVLAAASFIVAWAATKGKEPIFHESEHAERTHFFKEYLGVIKIKAFRPLIGYNVFSQIGGYLLTALAVHFFIYSLGASEGQISIIFLVYGIMNIIMAPLMGLLANKFGKKKILIILNAINVVALAVFLLIGFNLTTIYFFDLIIAFYFGSFYVLAFASTYDVATLDRLQNKKKDSRQGIVFAFFSFMMKVGVGLGMFISGLLLKISGFDESLMEQSAKALKGLHLGMTLIPGIFFLIGLLFLIKYPITKNRLAKIEDAVIAFDDGKEYSSEEIDDILK